jgi:putative copper resistance protein D
MVLTVSDVVGQPLSFVTPTVVASFTVSVSQGQALALQALLALTVAVLARLTVYRRGAAVAALLAVAAVLPPAFTGHAAGAGDHQLAVTSLAIHVLAASLWAGGLVALLVVRPRRLVPDVAARYSRMALVCWVAVVISGVANARIRLGTWHQVWHSSYGVLVLGKLLALLVLGGFGAAHRRWTLRRLRAGSPLGFLCLAAGELVVLGATFGLAVALSRSPTPVPTHPVEYDPFTDLVGFTMPPPITAARMIGQPLPDLFFLTIVAAGIGLYLAGLLRLRRAGHRWPWWRSASWILGMVVLGAITNLGFARYAYLLFSVHMAQHMVLSMVVPILLVGGAPVTLALRTLHACTDRAVRGPREWLLLILHSRAMRTLNHPLVALGIYVTSLYGLYLSNLFPVLMRSHLGHLAMAMHFLLSGYLLFSVLIGIDPGRRRVVPPLLILILLASMVFHAFFGVSLMQSQNVVAADWFTLVHPPWAAPLLSDQSLGASIAWSFGEIPAAIVMIILVMQWIRADEREQRRLNRAADRADADGTEDDLARYNEFLRQANAEAQAPPT